MLRAALIQLLLGMALLQGESLRSPGGNVVFDADSDSVAENLLDSTGLGVSTLQPTARLTVEGNARMLSGNVGIGTDAPGANLTLGRSYQIGGVEFVAVDTSFSTNAIILADTSGGNLTLTLPYAGNMQGRVYRAVKIHDLNELSVTTGVNVIDEAVTYTLSGNQAALEVVSTGNRWYVLRSMGSLRTAP